LGEKGPQGDGGRVQALAEEAADLTEGVVEAAGGPVRGEGEPVGLLECLAAVGDLAAEGAGGRIRQGGSPGGDRSSSDPADAGGRPLGTRDLGTTCGFRQCPSWQRGVFATSY
jgi:hypothetical protein